LVPPARLELARL